MLRVLRFTLPAVVTVLGAVLAAQQAPPAPSPEGTSELTIDQKLHFLETAQIVAGKEIGKGVTRPFRLTLTDGTLTHDAAFQAVDDVRWNEVEVEGGRTERGFKDYWGYNIAAFKLAMLIGLPDLVPPAVERTWNGKKGALVWWVKAQFDEEGRLKKKAVPPDVIAWNRQMRLMQLFTELTADTDRNMGNVLIMDDWRLVLIDFTRAFRLRSGLKSPERLVPCDPGVVARLKALTRDSLREGLRPYAGNNEVKTLLARRDLIVKRCTATETAQ
jgi:hypothetical protein